MKKFVLVLILISSAFILLGCQSGGRAVAGQWEPTQELQGGFEMPYQPVDYDYAGEISAEPVELAGEVETHMDCMVAEVTIKKGHSVVGAGDTEYAAKTQCKKDLVWVAWRDADKECMNYKKEDQQTWCSAASGTLNPIKDIVVTECNFNQVAGKFMCHCELNKDKDYVCNGH